MPKGIKIALLILVLCVVTAHGFIQESDEAQFRTTRLSDNVLVLTEVSPLENIVVALASQKGLVVIDTTGSRSAAETMRTLIEQEFGRKDFAYVVNTHNHGDHVLGNPVFPDAVVVCHENCRKALTQPGPQAAQFQKQSYKTFDDRMSLDLGNLTLNLIYFGRAHSNNDIFIQVPEEGLLMTGDLFLERGFLPLFSGFGQTDLDVPRWIEVLNEVLDGKDRVEHVIPGHRDIWEKERLVRWRDYIVKLWTGLVAAEKEGVAFKDAQDRFSLEKEFSYLTQWGLPHSDADIERFHEKNISAFWEQLKVSAAKIIEKVIDESGIEASVKKYHEMRSAPQDEYFFDESQFNALGYRLLGARRTMEAIEIFKLNIEAYPDSWNVYDSLGEAYLAHGNTELAVENYKKSLEMNPDNANARGILERIKRQEEETARREEKAHNPLSFQKRDDKGIDSPVKFTILYDNYVFEEGTDADWGFSCLIEGTEKTILFDTGTRSDILFRNIERLDVDVSKVEQIVISHDHGDHTGGLAAFLRRNHDVSVYLPVSFPRGFFESVKQDKARVVSVDDPVEICSNVFLTGEMGIQIAEQSLIINTSRGLVIVTGCSHQGIVNILKRAKEMLDRPIYLVFGGFHLMQHSDEDVEAIIQEFKNMGVEKCGATHCTGDRAIALFQEAFGENYVRMGTGRVVEIGQAE